MPNTSHTTRTSIPTPFLHMPQAQYGRHRQEMGEFFVGWERLTPDTKRWLTAIGRCRSTPPARWEIAELPKGNTAISQRSTTYASGARSQSTLPIGGGASLRNCTLRATEAHQSSASSAPQAHSPSTTVKRRTAEEEKVISARTCSLFHPASFLFLSLYFIQRRYVKTRKTLFCLKSVQKCV